jgi:hypothetical protein
MIVPSADMPPPAFMARQRLVFVRKLTSIPPGARSLAEAKTTEQHAALVSAFERGEFDELYVPFGHITGWRTCLTPARCDVEFRDDGWTEAELAQARARLSAA